MDPVQAYRLKVGLGAPADTTPKFKKKGGKGGFLTSLISEAAATAGGIGGFLLGGPVGAGIGAGTLGALGSGLEQKIRDNDIDEKRALTEGLFAGVTSAIPFGGVGKAAKGISAATKATAKAAAGATEKAAAQTAEKQALKRISQQIAENAAARAEQQTSRSVGRLAAGGEARAGLQSAGREAIENRQFNRLARENIERLAEENKTKIQLEPKFRTGGATDITVRRGGIEPIGETVGPRPIPSFASEGIEKRAVPDMPFAPRNLLLRPGSRNIPGLASAEAPLASEIAGDVVGDIAGTGGRQTAKKGFFNNFGRSGTIAEYSTLTTPSKQDAAMELARKYPKELRGSGRNKFQNYEKLANRLTDDVDKLFAGTTKNVPVGDIGRALNVSRNTIETGAEQHAFDNLVKDMGKVVPKGATELTGNEVNAMRRVLNKQAARTYRNLENGVQPTPFDRAVLEIKDILTGHLDEIGPAEVRVLNRDISGLLQAGPEWKKLSEQGLHVFGNRIQSAARPVQAASDYLGRGLNKAIAPTAAQVPRDVLSRRVVGGEFGKQLAASGLENATFGGEENPEGEAGVLGAESNVDYNAIRAEDQANQQSTGADVLGTDTSNNPFSAENIQKLALADLANGGKNINNLSTLYKLFGEEEKQTAAEKNAAAKTANIRKSIGILSKNFEGAGGGQGTGGLLSSFLGRTPGVRSLGLAPEAQVFEDKRRSLIAPLASAISGEVGVLTDRDIARAEGLLPRLSDPTDVAQQKLQELDDLLSGAGTAGAPRDFAEEFYAGATGQ